MAGITLLPNAPFYSGGRTAADVPFVWPVALGGHGYMLDLESDEFRHSSIPLLRAQADTSTVRGEHSLNPDDLWPTGTDSWHHGAGQTHLDDTDADPERFRSSKGVDPWTRSRLSLLPTTTESRTSANTNLALAVNGADLYAIDGQTCHYTTDLSSWSSALTGTPASTPTSIASDGYRTYIAYPSDLYSSIRASSSAAVYHSAPLPCSLVRVVKGRIMVAGVGGTKHVIYNSGASGSAPPSALYTHPNPDFAWVDFCAGPAAIYAAGYAGDKSLIYRIALVADGTALAIPIVAAELPDGEIVRSLGGYLGFVMIGTDQGVRFSVPDRDGNLQIGDLIPTNAVYAFEGQDRYVWYGNTNYDATSTGLGRLDLSVLNGTRPAWASDLMVTGQGAVKSVVTFLGRRVFTVSGDGIYYESDDLVASGTIDSGLISYGITDPKTALEATVRWAAGAGTIAASLSADEGAFATLGATNTTSGTAAGSARFGASQTAGELFETRFTLTRSDGDATAGPVLDRWTLRADPSVARRERIVVPILLHRRLVTLDGIERQVDVAYELDHIRGLAESRQIVAYQEGLDTYSVRVDEWEWRPFRSADAPTWVFDGTILVALKTI